jgi:protein-disulfide isomerase
VLIVASQAHRQEQHSHKHRASTLLVIVVVASALVTQAARATGPAGDATPAPTGSGAGSLDWRTAEDLPGVDLSGLSADERRLALDFMRMERCTCGCDMRIAECLVVDPSCPSWPRLPAVVVEEVRYGQRGEALARAVTAAMAPDPTAWQARPARLGKRRRLRLDGRPSRGPDRAPVTLALFLDPHGRHTRAVLDQVGRVEAAFPGRVRVVALLLPARGVEAARAGAEAAAAAHAQGAFWPMLERLVAGAPRFSPERLAGRAGESGIEPERLARARRDQRAALERDRAAARRAGVEAAPALLVNGRPYLGPPLFSPLRDLVASELERRSDPGR